MNGWFTSTFVPQGYILNFASSATKKLSDSVVETASTIKRTVEEGNIDGLFDKVCLFTSWHGYTTSLPSVLSVGIFIYSFARAPLGVLRPFLLLTGDTSLSHWYVDA